MKNALIQSSFALLLAVAGIGCQGQPTYQQLFVNTVEQAHNRRVYDRAEALAVDVEFLWQSDYRFRGTLLYETGAMRSKLIAEDGSVMVFDGKQAYVKPAAAATAEARYLLLAMPYFVAAPFKLDESGISLAAPPDNTLPFYGVQVHAAILQYNDKHKTEHSASMILYLARDKGYLEAIGGIQTGPEHQDILSPRAIVYRDFVDVDGVKLASVWDFYPWSESDGPTGGLLGRAKLSNFRFVVPVKDAFKAPADSTVVSRPQM
jgi:hypothetical protein